MAAPDGSMPDADVSRIVEDGYDHMAEHYLASKRRDDPVLLAALHEMARHLPHRGRVLDLGCGAGVPATQWLAQRFTVTGVDLSASQVALARGNVPEATIIQADMTTLDLPDAAFDGLIALHSLIHVPRSAQPALLRRIVRWCKPGGLFLATWAVQAWEGRDENWQGWGAPMWWSHHGEAYNLAMLQGAGFLVQSAERHTADGEAWLWVLARSGRHDLGADRLHRPVSAEPEWQD